MLAVGILGPRAGVAVDAAGPALYLDEEEAFGCEDQRVAIVDVTVVRDTLADKQWTFSDVSLAATARTAYDSWAVTSQPHLPSQALY